MTYFTDTTLSVELKAQAAAGNGDALADLGLSYIVGGDGIKSDTLKGLELLHKGVLQLSEEAIISLARFYSRIKGFTGHDGHYIEKDHYAAYRLFSKASELGSGRGKAGLARIMLASPHVSGLSEEENRKQAQEIAKQAERIKAAKKNKPE